MKLRKRLLWLFIPILALTLAAVGALSERLLLSRFDRQDSAQLMNKARQLQERMELDISRHLDLLRSLAWWDATYAFIGQPRADYIRSNLPAARLANLDLDFMVFFDRQPRIVAQTWRARDLLDLIDLLPAGKIPAGTMNVVAFGPKLAKKKVSPYMTTKPIWLPGVVQWW